MKASELVKELNWAIEMHGDLPVRYHRYKRGYTNILGYEVTFDKEDPNKEDFFDIFGNDLVEYK